LLLEKELSLPEVVNDMEKYRKYSKEYAALKEIVTVYDEYVAFETEKLSLESLLKEEDPNGEYAKMAKEELRDVIDNLGKKQKEIEEILLDDDQPELKKSAIMEIRAGTGGVEAGLFAGSLFKMYSKYAAAKGWKISIFSKSETELGAIKEIIYAVEGVSVFKFLRFEMGTHRVQRVPETESGGRIHTSAATVAVLPEAEDVEIDIDPNDLRIDVYRASGAGGQHVNTTDSAVRITHEPTGIVVSCQDERSQHKNKAKGMRVLKARLYEKMQEDQKNERSAARKKQVGSGDRSEKIRTYNFPENRVTDHRIKLSLYNLENILEGALDELIEALMIEDRKLKLQAA